MTMRFNEEMTEGLLAKFSELSFSRVDGRMFADKSYGFDTMFFCCRFILRFSKNNIFQKSKYLLQSNDYIKDIFCIQGKGTGIPNYMNEAINLLCFSGALMPGDAKGEYIICDRDLLELYSSIVENAYIVQYMLAYCVFKKDGLWPIYEKFVNATTIDGKAEIFEELVNSIQQKAPTLGDWAKSVAKFSINILNFANRSNTVARTGNIKKQIVQRTDIAVNVKGTRSGEHSVKKNSYLDDLSDEYILKTLEPFLLRKVTNISQINLSDGFAASIADTKMDMIDKTNDTDEGKIRVSINKYSLALAKVRTVQDVFRRGLLKTTEHKCPVCGFDFEKMLTASHILPYTKCECTEDAMNPNNGLLMCPVCDRLFESESGLYMTIDSENGHIKYVDEIQDVKWFKYIQGVRIDDKYLTTARKSFLKWHNDSFNEKHKHDIIHDSINVAIEPKEYSLNINESRVADNNDVAYDTENKEL